MSEHAGFLREAIIRWYDHNGRDLPMRSPSVSAWGTLVFEVMSHQTPIPRVQPIWLQWMDRWPTPADLANASPAEVLVVWDRLGYPSRALRLRECAVAIADSYGGVVPSSYEELLALPGIGPYTASAVASFSYHLPVPVLDTNIRRVLGRIVDGVERPAASTPSRTELARATALVPSDGDEAAAWNVSVMELGALVCTARSPLCQACPVSEVCAWRAAGYPAAPGKKKTQAWVGTDRQARGRVMAALRAAHQEAEAGALGEGGRPGLGEDGLPGSAKVGITMEQALEAATLPDADPAQAQRVVDGLLRDGLVSLNEDGCLHLPH